MGDGVGMMGGLRNHSSIHTHGPGMHRVDEERLLTGTFLPPGNKKYKNAKVGVTNTPVPTTQNK